MTRALATPAHPRERAGWAPSENVLPGLAGQASPEDSVRWPRQPIPANGRAGHRRKTYFPGLQGKHRLKTKPPHPSVWPTACCVWQVRYAAVSPNNLGWKPPGPSHRILRCGRPPAACGRYATRQFHQIISAGNRRGRLLHVLCQHPISLHADGAVRRVGLMEIPVDVQRADSFTFYASIRSVCMRTVQFVESDSWRFQSMYNRRVGGLRTRVLARCWVFDGAGAPDVPVAAENPRPARGRPPNAGSCSLLGVRWSGGARCSGGSGESATLRLVGGRLGMRTGTKQHRRHCCNGKLRHQRLHPAPVSRRTSRDADRDETTSTTLLQRQAATPATASVAGTSWSAGSGLVLACGSPDEQPTVANEARPDQVAGTSWSAGSGLVLACGSPDEQPTVANEARPDQIYEQANAHGQKVQAAGNNMAQTDSAVGSSWA